jgi:TonB-dependent receptor
MNWSSGWLWRSCAVAALGFGVLAAAPAMAQTTEVEEVVVTGYRASLADAIQTKRQSNEIVDAIQAEDIADFPDLNLAEALQRIPGVAIDRDGGEGRSITVRGLSGEFTRVRINGLEALATTGGKDSAGGANRGRAFDFQVFASELFNQALVRKSQSASIEEGSLGATVELTTARPFNYPEDTVVMGAQVGYNDLSESYDPRASLLVSDRWFDGRLGGLVSFAYSSRHILEEGGSSGRWENPTVPTNSAGCFQTPGPCNTPTGTYSAVNSAWHARIPRYGRLTHDWERYGLTAALQFNPSDYTSLTLDALASRIDGVRDEQYLGVFSMWHRRQGNNLTDVRNPVFDDQNQLVSATFDDVDIRSEARYDELSSDFRQVSLVLDHSFSDRLRLTGRLGTSRSDQDNPIQTTISMDRYDVDGFAYDFSQSQSLFDLSYGFDVTDPANWAVTASNALGDPSFLRMRPNATSNSFDSAGADLVYVLTDTLTLKGGLTAKRYGFETTEERRFPINGFTDGAVPLPAGVTLAQVTRLLSGFGRGLDLPANTPRTWLTPDARAIAAALDLYCDCVNAFGDFRIGPENQLGANREVEEESLGGYLQLEFDTSLFGLSVRGNAGVRQVSTSTVSSGFVGINPVTVANDYDDTLPSLNLVIEPAADLFVRFGAAMVMARPQLPFLTPGGTISNTARTLTVGNPLLEPIRANTYDLSVEWNPAPAVLFSASLFRKDLESYIQSSSQTLRFGDTGLPDSLLANQNTADTLFQVTQLLNTEGGELTGYELGVQGPFSFLPAPFDRFGGIVNYTHVDSTVTYITNSAVTPPTTVRLPLLNLSPVSWNATLYYEDERFTARVSAAYRDEYIGLVPGGNGNDARGKDETLNIDMSMSYSLTERFSLTLEGLNLTDEAESRWISIERRNSEEYSHTGRQVFIGGRYRF